MRYDRVRFRRERTHLGGGGSTRPSNRYIEMYDNKNRPPRCGDKLYHSVILHAWKKKTRKPVGVLIKKCSKGGPYVLRIWPVASAEIGGLM